MELKAIDIAKLTSCADEGKVKEISEEIGIDYLTAKLVRRNWILQFTGRCMQCEGILEGDTCTVCGSTVDLKPKLDKLEKIVKIEPKMVLISRKCKCGCTFNYLAEFVLKKTLQYGNFRASFRCKACRMRRSISGSVNGSAEPESPKKRRKIEPVDVNSQLVRADEGAREFVNGFDKSELSRMADELRQLASGG